MCRNSFTKYLAIGLGCLLLILVTVSFAFIFKFIEKMYQKQRKDQEIEELDDSSDVKVRNSNGEIDGCSFLNQSISVLEDRSGTKSIMDEFVSPPPDYIRQSSNVLNNDNNDQFDYETDNNTRKLEGSSMRSRHSTRF